MELCRADGARVLTPQRAEITTDGRTEVFEPVDVYYPNALLVRHVHSVETTRSPHHIIPRSVNSASRRRPARFIYIRKKLKFAAKRRTPGLMVSSCRFSSMRMQSESTLENTSGLLTLKKSDNRGKRVDLEASFITVDGEALSGVWLRLETTDGKDHGKSMLKFVRQGTSNMSEPRAKLKCADSWEAAETTIVQGNGEVTVGMPVSFFSCTPDPVPKGSTTFTVDGCFEFRNARGVQTMEQRVSETFLVCRLRFRTVFFHVYS